MATSTLRKDWEMQYFSGHIIFWVKLKFCEGRRKGDEYCLGS